MLSFIVIKENFWPFGAFFFLFYYWEGNLEYLSISNWQTLARVNGVVANQNNDITMDLENSEEEMHFIQIVSINLI